MSGKIHAWLFLAAIPLFGADSPAARAARLAGAMPVTFELNQGQAAPDVRYVSRSGGMLTLYRADQIEMRFGPRRSEIVQMRFAGGATAPRIAGEARIGGRTSLLAGSDPAAWVKDIVNYSRLRYREVYPGIDLLLYGSGGEIEYDWIVAPGADAGRIRISFRGARRVRLDKNGDLLVPGGSGHAIRHKRPVIYQEDRQHRKRVAGEYALFSGREVGFSLGDYDTSRTLIIDPHLIYATSFGGFPLPGYVPGTVNGGGAKGMAIAVGAGGSAYVAGAASEADWLTGSGSTAPPQGAGGGFVCKFTPDGSSFEYALYLAGSELRAITVDSAGNAYVTGLGNSAFPQVGPLQPARNYQGVVVAKVNPKGNGLVWSFILGGGGLPIDVRGFAETFHWTPAGRETTAGQGIALDAEGNVYVAGSTVEPIFTTPEAFQRTRPATACPQKPYCAEGFVTKIDRDATRVMYSTFLGGSDWDFITGLAVDPQGYAYVTGFTSSSDFPVTPGALQPAPPKPVTSDSILLENAFVSKLMPDGTGLVYSSYLGGSSRDRAYGIALDSQGRAYVTGITESLNFPKLRSGFMDERPACNHLRSRSVDTAGNVDCRSCALTPATRRPLCPPGRGGDTAIVRERRRRSAPDKFPDPLVVGNPPKP